MRYMRWPTKMESFIEHWESERQLDSRRSVSVDDRSDETSFEDEEHKEDMMEEAYKNRRRWSFPSCLTTAK